MIMFAVLKFVHRKCSFVVAVAVKRRKIRVADKIHVIMTHLRRKVLGLNWGWQMVRETATRFMRVDSDCGCCFPLTLKEPKVIGIRSEVSFGRVRGLLGKL